MNIDVCLYIFIHINVQKIVYRDISFILNISILTRSRTPGCRSLRFPSFCKCKKIEKFFPYFDSYICVKYVKEFY